MAMKKWFVPQEDITAYELARVYRMTAIGHLSLSRAPVVFTSEQWETLPWELKRHFSDTED